MAFWEPEHGVTYIGCYYTGRGGIGLEYGFFRNLWSNYQIGMWGNLVIVSQFNPPLSMPIAQSTIHQLYTTWIYGNYSVAFNYKSSIWILFDIFNNDYMYSELDRPLSTALKNRSIDRISGVFKVFSIRLWIEEESPAYCSFSANFLHISMMATWYGCWLQVDAYIAFVAIIGIVRNFRGWRQRTLIGGPLSHVDWRTNNSWPGKTMRLEKTMRQNADPKFHQFKDCTIRYSYCSNLADLIVQRCI